MKDTVFNVRISRTDHAELAKIAEQEDRSIASLIRLAVRAFLNGRTQ